MLLGVACRDNPGLVDGGRDGVAAEAGAPAVDAQAAADAALDAGAGGGPGPGDGATDKASAADDGPAPADAAPDAAGGADGSSASGDAPADASPPPPNTRLEARQLEADGAPPLVLGIWDTREKVHCTFVTAEDGKLRCLPEVLQKIATPETYADEECQRPVVWADPTLQRAPVDRPFTLPLDHTACEPIRHQVLRPLPEGSPLYARTTGGPCKSVDRATQMPPVTGAVPFVPAAPDDWEVATESQALRLSDRVRLAEKVTPDGARFVDRLVDDRWNMTCALQPGSTSGTVECRPPTAQSASPMFADDACTVPLFGTAACQEAAFIAEGSASFFALGAPFTGTLYWRALQCDARETATTAPSGPRYYLKGAPLGADAVAPVHEGTVGTARFQLRGLMQDGGGVAPIPLGLFSYGGYPYFDSAAGEDCRPIWTSDGQVRCLPASVWGINETYFSDPECQRFIFGCDKGPACDSQRVLRTKRRADGRVDATIVYGASRRLATTNLYFGDGTTCALIGSSVMGISEVTGAEVPLDTFPALHERHPLPTLN